MGRGNKNASTNLLYIASDVVFGCISYFIAAICTGKLFDDDWSNYLIVAVIFMLIYLLSNKESRIYNITTFFYIDRVIRCMTKSVLIATAVTSTLLFYIGNAQFEGAFYIAFLITTYLSMFLSAMIMRIIVKKGKVLAPRTLLIGGMEHYNKFINYLHKSNTEAEIIGYVSIKAEDKGKSEYLGSIEDLEEIIKKNNIDQVCVKRNRML